MNGHETLKVASIGSEASSTGPVNRCEIDDDDLEDLRDVTSDVHKEKAEAIAKRESNIVFGMRLVVFIVLIASTTALAIRVHKYLDNVERDEFREEFDSAATKVFQSMGTSIDLTLGAIDALAVSFISFARATNQTWPFVTMDDFALPRHSDLQSLSTCRCITLYLVNKEPSGKTTQVSTTIGYIKVSFYRVRTLATTVLTFSSTTPREFLPSCCCARRHRFR